MAKARRKTKKKSSPPMATIFTLVGAIVLLGVGGLYWLKSSSSVTIEQKVVQEVANPLPPPPEEKWSYIKALENRKVNEGMIEEPTLPASPVVQAPIQKPVAVIQTQPQKPETVEIIVPEPVVPKANIQPKLEEVAKKEEKPRQKKELWAVLDKPSTQKLASTPAPTSSNATSGKFGLQCGAFDKAQSAEKRKVQLTLLGQNAYVKQSGNWFRVYVAAVGDRSQAERVRDSLKGNVDCFVLGM